MSLFDTDVAPAVAEARLLHPTQGGYFSVGVKGRGDTWKEDLYPMSTLETVAKSVRGHADTYISQASFASKLRRSFNTQSLRCVFVDLDTYNADSGKSQPELAEQIKQIARENGVADPSYIASSGRGMYAKWVFDNPINASLQPQWKLLQQKLMSLYLPMGADRKVIDAARVLRLQETINSKNGGEVSLIEQGTTHSFADLFRSSEGLQILRPKDGKLVRANDSVVRKGIRLRSSDLMTDEALTDLDGLTLYSEQRNPVMLKQMTAQSLSWSRFLDLRDLVIRRGGIHKGSRDITLFWMTTFLAQAGIIEPGNFWNEVKSLLMSFPTGRDFNPVADGSLSTLQRRIESQARGEKIMHNGVAYAPIYTPRNDTLLNMLGVTADEEMVMRTIISSGEKLRRADLKAPGRSERRVEREELRSVAVSMAAQGHTPSDIARELGRNRSTIGRWLTPETNVGMPYVETRGRRKNNDAHGPRVRLTGRGPVVVGGSSPTTSSPVPGAKKGMTQADLAARMRTRQQKPHLRADTCLWNRDQLEAWLHARRKSREEKAACQPEPCMADAGADQKSAVASEISTALFARIRKSIVETTPRISLSPSGCLSSKPMTGPP